MVGNRIKPGDQRQFTQAFTAKIDPRINPTWRQGAFQTQGLIRKVQPLVFLAQAQGATAGIDDDGAFGAAGG
ncbi:hypothetical protein D3C72_1560290 [compost metagenome]